MGSVSAGREDHASTGMRALAPRAGSRRGSSAERELVREPGRGLTPPAEVGGLL